MNVICTVVFSEEDVEAVFEKIHGRKPSRKELDDCLDKIDTDGLQEACVDLGYEMMKTELRGNGV